MICRLTFFFGPVIAVLLLSDPARSAHHGAPKAASMPEVKVSKFTGNPVVWVSHDATAVWRQTRAEAPANIRFIKPNIPTPAHAAASTGGASTGATEANGGASIQSISHDTKRDGPALREVPVKRIEAIRQAAADIAPDPVLVTGITIRECNGQPAKADSQLARATAAKLRQLIEQSMPQDGAGVQQQNQLPLGDGGHADEMDSTNARTQLQRPTQFLITDEGEHAIGPCDQPLTSAPPGDLVQHRVDQQTGSPPNQLWSAGTRLLHGIGQLIPWTGSRSSATK
jgi:hypothetical protein